MTPPTPLPEPAPSDAKVRHRTIKIDGISVFYREAGPPEAPVVLLPHGYPSSSFQYRNFMPALGDRWRLIAPDYPGFGYSETPDRTRFDYTFDGYAGFLERFVEGMDLTRYAIYLHDYGSQFGLRLAMKAPEQVAALIIQNGDIYEDQHGPKYGPLKEYWVNPSLAGREKLGEAVRRLHARRRRPRLSARPAGRGAAPARRRALGARD